MQTIPTNGYAARDRAVAAAGPADGEVRMECREVFKIFDPRPEPALAMLRGGAKKDEVLAKLGIAVGVDAATFAVRPGEIFVVMGLSGSGKSTLVRLLNRLIEPSAGAVLLDGEDLTKMSAKELIAVRRRDMSFVFQSFALMPHLSALENAAFGLSLAGVAKDKRRDAAMAALEKVGLGTYAERLPSEMSGGMQQRVGLARALAKNPSIMFMDEAFSALDPLIRTGMQDELLRLQAENRRTIIFISHDLDEAVRIGDRIAIMESGRIVQVGTPTEILLNPADDYVRTFFRHVDPGKVLCAGDVADAQAAPSWTAEETASAAGAPGLMRELDESGSAHAHLVDERGRYRATLARDRLADAARQGRPLADARVDGLAPVREDTRLSEIMGSVAEAKSPVPVVCSEGVLRGSISRARLLGVLQRAH